MEKIRVFPAVEFVCDSCGKNSFASLVGVEIPAENLANEIKNSLELNDRIDVAANFFLHPEEVTCQHCKTKYIVDFEEYKFL